jgi:uncharacterized protein YjbJ (UPF0337 family)
VNRDVIEGHWKQFEGSVRERWGKLTNDHFDIIAGKREIVRGKILVACGIRKDDALKHVAASEAPQKDCRTSTTA